MALGATCVQRLDGSRDSAIHTKYRISLRSSSMQEPRYPAGVSVLSGDTGLRPDAPSRPPALSTTHTGGRAPAVVRCSPTETLLRLLLPLNDKVQWTSHHVAGSGPPTSPQSEHFTGPFNR
ncbi:hypothetical protein VNO80_31499 [Phaseolus coccineus]|uniref:Uncharacterized protein n=1 Tax=Phaseolus coccineus TaxID=3886 RepID=A0AAN9L236_PHACN